VLLAEDNAVGAEVAIDLLEDAGMTVDLARDGQEALERARARTYDFVVMDMQMPRMDGIAATRAIRAVPGWRRPPIIALTANVFAGDRRRCEEAGMDDFLTKPLQPGELYRTLLRWLDPLSHDEPQEAMAPAADPACADAADAEARLGRVAALPGMHRDFVLAYGGRARKYLELLGAFIARHAGTPQALRGHLAGGHPETAADLAHSLAGEAAVLGIRSVQRSANAMEDDLLQAGGPDMETAQVDLEELERALLAVTDAADLASPQHGPAQA
jgi:CheY-like chemotaxis protein